MFELSKLIRSNIKSLVPYSSARAESSDLSAILLDANENPFGDLNRYPDPYQKELKSIIAKNKGVNLSSVFLGNGSDEIIDLCFRIFCEPYRDKAIQLSPTYGMYQVAADINAVEMVSVKLNDDFQLDQDVVKNVLSISEAKLLFICSPNNPIGNLIDTALIEKILNAFQGIVIIDEAYIDFTSQKSWIHRLEDFPNLIVMQTLSKAWGLAGIRLGMAFSNHQIISVLDRIKPPYNISSLNQKAAIQTLLNFESFELNVHLIIEQRDVLVTKLLKLPFIQKIYPSDANFILVKMDDASMIYNKLKQGGIIVRNRHSIVENCLRISVGSPEENSKLLETLQS